MERIGSATRIAYPWLDYGLWSFAALAGLVPELSLQVAPLLVLATLSLMERAKGMPSKVLVGIALWCWLVYGLGAYHYFTTDQKLGWAWGLIAVLGFFLWACSTVRFVSLASRGSKC